MGVCGYFQLSVPVYHRMVWVRIQKTLKILQFQPPCQGQEHLSLEQVAQSCISVILQFPMGSYDSLCFFAMPPLRPCPFRRHEPPASCFIPTVKLQEFR